MQNVYENALNDTDPVRHLQRIYGRHHYKHGPKCMTCQCLIAHFNELERRHRECWETIRNTDPNVYGD